MPGLIIPSLTAALITTLGIFLARPLLTRHALDAPNHRSSHVVPTPRGGGVAVLLGIAAGSMAGYSHSSNHRELLTFALVVTMFAVLGLIEDLAGLPVWIRLFCQLGIGAGCVYAFRNAELSDLPWLPGLWLAAGLALLGVFYVNVANFMDGVNGISALHGLVAGAYFCLIGFSVLASSLVVCSLVVSVAFATFLPWNLLRPRLFLGDVGSYLLGASVWLLAAGSILLGMGLVVSLAPLVIYSSDVVASLGRRALTRSSLLAPHRDHTYQQVHQITGSHLTAALACTAGTLLCLVAGWSARWGLPEVAGATIFIVVSVMYLSLPRMLRKHFVRGQSRDTSGY